MLPSNVVPAISVIMPVRNGLPYVELAMASVLDQSFRDFEFLIVDDGSVDGTIEVLDAAAAKDSRIRLTKLPQSGMHIAVNHGLRIARGELVARMDADDVCTANRFQRQKEYLDNHPEIVAVGSWAWAIDEQGTRLFSIKVPTETSEMEPRLLQGINCFIHPSMMYRRSQVLAVGAYEDEYPTDDFGLWLRLAERWQMANLPEYLLNYRLSASANSIHKHESQRQAAAKILRKAYTIRSLGEPPELPPDQSPRSVPRIHHHWAMSAVAEGFWAAGRKHALIALRSEPSNLHAWLTLFKSFIHLRSLLKFR